MSEPTESDVGALLDAAARYFSEPATPVIAAHYVQTACNIARSLAESWLRQRERIAALEAERNPLLTYNEHGMIVGFGRGDYNYDAALRRIDAEVARCYGIEHP